MAHSLDIVYEIIGRVEERAKEHYKIYTFSQDVRISCGKNPSVNPCGEQPSFECTVFPLVIYMDRVYMWRIKCTWLVSSHIFHVYHPSARTP